MVAGGNMIDLLCPPEIRATKNNSDHFIRLTNGSIIKIGGTDNLDVVGMNGYGYVFSEWQSQKKEAFGYISPILQENGGWALFNGTMRGKRNHLYEDVKRTANLESWFSEWLSPEDTLEYYWINEEEDICVNPQLIGEIHPHTLRPYQNIQDLVDAGEISFALARQEYLNRAENEISGGYYGHEIKALRKRKGICKIDPFNDVVYTFWDLGGVKEENDKTAILFAHINTADGSIKVVDYYENRGKLRGHYFDVLDAKGYNYAGHYYPHDGKKATNVWTGETHADSALNERGVEVRFIPKTQKTANDIEITRRGFRNVSFDEDRTGELIDHVSNYHERETTGTPCHNNNCSECLGASHGADAFRYMHMALYHGLVEPYLVEASPSRWPEPESRIDDEWICV
jgi:hypothetical protein